MRDNTLKYGQGNRYFLKILFVYAPEKKEFVLI